MRPAKPPSRADRVSLWAYARAFRRDILSAQPERLYRAWMAEFRTPFFRSFLVNQPDLVRMVLCERPEDFPKSRRIAEGLKPLLGNSVFVSNGATWQRQRRIIDPAFEGGRLRDTFPAMCAAGAAMVERLGGRVGEVVDMEPVTAHAAADVIFRTLFSIPIEHRTAAQVFEAFRKFQRSQPILNAAAFVPLTRFLPWLHRRDARRAAREIRQLIDVLVHKRLADIDSGVAPDDLATKILTTPDPTTGATFSREEMVDQVAIFFLAGHETSASALAWAIYLLALSPEWQSRVAAEAATSNLEDFGAIAGLGVSRDVFREALRLYPPVPMMVREARCPTRFRDRDVPPGGQVVISPWHLHRHARIWDAPDEFDPGRWQTSEGRACARDAFIPFSSGPRVCPGAGFAMIEGPLLLSMLVRHYEFILAEPEPTPMAHLTVRSRDGIRVLVRRREQSVD